MTREEINKYAAEEFAREYCKIVDSIFLESLDNMEQIHNLADLLQFCLDTTSKGYGFKVNERD
jgi:hypothetical protein